MGANEWTHERVTWEDGQVAYRFVVNPGSPVPRHEIVLLRSHPNVVSLHVHLDLSSHDAGAAQELLCGLKCALPDLRGSYCSSTGRSLSLTSIPIPTRGERPREAAALLQKHFALPAEFMTTVDSLFPLA